MGFERPNLRSLRAEADEVFPLGCQVEIENILLSLLRAPCARAELGQALLEAQPNDCNGCERVGAKLDAACMATPYDVPHAHVQCGCTLDVLFISYAVHVADEVIPVGDAVVLC